MKVLSLLQPWATLVVIGAKKIETRSWRTGYRGSLLIHASMGKGGGLLAAEEPFSFYIKKFDALPFGCIIGMVTLVDVVPVEHLNMAEGVINKLTLEERAFGNYDKGRYAWLLDDAVKFNKPIPARGHLNLWNYDIDVDTK